jgi:hypothetical protein
VDLESELEELRQRCRQAIVTHLATRFANLERSASYEKIAAAARDRRRKPTENNHDE